MSIESDIAKVKNWEYKKPSSNALAQRKLVYGVGKNDADYVTRPTVNGKKITCPVYRKWCSMLQRCYDPIYHQKWPTYIGCSVIPEWHSFLEYEEWCRYENWEGLHLDKDIINPGNKVYSPDTCCFVSGQLNMLMNDHGVARGEYPIGVCYHKPRRKYVASCSFNGKQQHIGIYTTPEAASIEYVIFKAKVIHNAAMDKTLAPNIAAGLMLHRAILLESIA